MHSEFNLHELKTAQRLPSPSGTALAIMRLVQDSDATVEALAALVKTDPALTSRVLAFANSAEQGARRPVASIHDAIIRTGMLAVRNFALSLSVLSRYRSGCPGFDYDAYWSQALAMAVAASTLIARERTVPQEEAFTLGLLSDIGRLALATAWAEQYGDCLGSANGEALLHLERERFAVDHEELTLLLLQDWGLPAIFLDGLKASFDPPVAPEGRVERLAQQLAMARLTARYCVADDDYREKLMPALAELGPLHGLNGDVLQDFLASIEQAWYQWGRMIDVGTELRQSAPDDVDKQKAAAGLDILLVDDDPMLLMRLSKQLTAVGHRVATCQDGEAALKRVIEQKPQVIVTDWHMKPVDGLALCRSLRQTEIGKDIYLIMLTASESEDELVEAFDAGIDDYVTKPVSIRILQARLRAGQRIVSLQAEVELEKQAILRYSDELSLANRRLSQMANTDVLTGLPNRRYALQRLKQEWESAQRYHRPLSVLILDLDHFKSINDTLGHDAGDIALIHAAKVIRSACRSSDVACRLGGEEFVVIATNTDGATAARLAERIRSAIHSRQPDSLDLSKPLTVSIGVAGSTAALSQTDAAAAGWQNLMKLADKALYQVKAESRNAVRLAASLV
ncbi:MAG: diguanylate cyclase [Methylomonas sp.]|nr:diguanylate cyclase [Methylomonas sp.]PPD22367.1 MAG: diguanylate cyclase response regulator [Methylomonas sp.]PPD26871.1 MAG: diguanylate cyclase response regulator [Methylomonas sp.]PPD37748.1 MAG: diguanylate cyclase response regulator [Methylomonas sp.]PPD38778.1 MAG: diguanylate cyclase response regulator [Methylomonas sp.]